MGSVTVAAVLAMLVCQAPQSAQAGDTKPLKGWAFSTNRQPLSAVPDDPYLNAVVDDMGAPDYAIAVTGINFNNVSGKCLDQNVEIGYYLIDQQTGKNIIRFYASGEVTAPNGDTVSYAHEGVAELDDDPVGFSYELAITGGTGRFAGASGAVAGEGVSEWPFLSHYEGWTTTVGSLMRDK